MEDHSDQEVGAAISEVSALVEAGDWGEARRRLGQLEIGEEGSVAPEDRQELERLEALLESDPVARWLAVVGALILLLVSALLWA